MPTATDNSSRRPRFRRPLMRVSLQLTLRDFDILRAVATHRFLNSQQIARLVVGADKKIIERAGQLYYAGYLERPPAQLEYYRAGGGSTPIVYGIANRGAQVLIERDGREQTDVDWSRKNTHATRRFILHTLAVADVAVAALEATSADARYSLQQGDALMQLMPSATRAMAKPLKWRVKVKHRDQPLLEVGVVPDFAFALVYADGSRRCFVVEADRGTMPVERETLKQTSILKKLLAYETGRKQRLHEKQFGWKNFRVLLVTNTAERAANIRAAILRYPVLKGSPLFLVSDVAALAAGNILTQVWQDAHGTTHDLV